MTYIKEAGCYSITTVLLNTNLIHSNSLLSHPLSHSQPFSQAKFGDLLSQKHSKQMHPIFTPPVGVVALQSSFCSWP